MPNLGILRTYYPHFSDYEYPLRELRLQLRFRAFSASKSIHLLDQALTKKLGEGFARLRGRRDDINHLGATTREIQTPPLPYLTFPVLPSPPLLSKLIHHVKYREHGTTRHEGFYPADATWANGAYGGRRGWRRRATRIQARAGWQLYGRHGHLYVPFILTPLFYAPCLSFCDKLTEPVWTVCMACWCPCIAYGKNVTRFRHLRDHNQPHPSNGGSCGSDCWVHCLLTSCFAAGWVLEVRSCSLPGYFSSSTVFLTSARRYSRVRTRAIGTASTAAASATAVPRSGARRAWSLRSRSSSRRRRSICASRVPARSRRTCKKKGGRSPSPP